MIQQIGAWFLSVVFGTYLAHGLLLQFNEKRIRHRWYHWEPLEKRRYTARAENPVEYWWTMGVQCILLAICIYVALRNV
ncbi:MAG: hypothetical protein V4735_04010 [Pseudomonadota bacterium]